MFLQAAEPVQISTIKDHREKVVRILQGNLYLPETLWRAEGMIAVMEQTYDKAMAGPRNLLGPLGTERPPDTSQ